MKVTKTYFLWNGVQFMPRLMDLSKVVFPVEGSHSLPNFLITLIKPILEIARIIF